MSLASEDGIVADLEVRLPMDQGKRTQDEEWYEVSVEGETRRIRFHDYAQTYATPGLYEHIFYETLKCDSPRTVCALLAEQIEAERVEPGELRVLDIGAGNGMVGEQLVELGADEVVGVDILEEAARAAERDRPGVYDDYLVLDLTDMPEQQHQQLRSRRLNCLMSVAALGFNDIPPVAFAEAYNVIEPDGLVGFSIKEEMISGDDSSEFSRLIDGAVAEEALELKAERRYRHRLSTNGEPLYYVAMVARKKADLRVAG